MFLAQLLTFLLEIWRQSVKCYNYFINLSPIVNIHNLPMIISLKLFLLVIKTLLLFSLTDFLNYLNILWPIYNFLDSTITSFLWLSLLLKLGKPNSHIFNHPWSSCDTVLANKTKGDVFRAFGFLIKKRKEQI